MGWGGPWGGPRREKMLPALSTPWVGSQKGWLCSWPNRRSVSALRPLGSLQLPVPCLPGWGTGAAVCLPLLPLLLSLSLKASSQALHGRQRRDGKTPSSLPPPPKSCSYSISAMLPPALRVPQNAILQH